MLLRTNVNSSRPFSVKNCLSTLKLVLTQNAPIRNASSSSSRRWVTRQNQDKHRRDARLKGLASRAAFKLLEIDARYRIFQAGQVVVDLGYAPGSWSQVAIDRVSPGGKVIGVDLLPAVPPRGVSTIQGDFLSPAVQEEVQKYLTRAHAERDQEHMTQTTPADGSSSGEILNPGTQYSNAVAQSLGSSEKETESGTTGRHHSLIDVVLSDMSAPWAQATGFGRNSVVNPYRRMMNTSGVKFRDHADSMDLCTAALTFARKFLTRGGHFVCKFYQGQEDKAFEMQLKAIFQKVHREKPQSSRTESREGFFVALNKIT